MNKRKTIKKSINIILYCTLSLTLIILVINISVQRKTKDQLYSDISSIPKNKVGLVLGTIKNIGKYKNPYFYNRIQAAKELYNANKIEYIVVSGDNSRIDYNEPEDMKKALIEAGIPEGRIYLDYAGFRTLDSVVRMNEIFGQYKFTIISQKFHNERAVLIANHYHMDVCAYNAKDIPFKFGIKTQLREKLARVKVYWDFMINKQPKFFGDKVEIGKRT